MSPFSTVRTGTTQAQGSQPFRPPSCLTLRGAGIENSVKKWFSARASVLMLMWLVFSLAYHYAYAYILVKTSLKADIFFEARSEQSHFLTY